MGQLEKKCPATAKTPALSPAQRKSPLGSSIYCNTRQTRMLDHRLGAKLFREIVVQRTVLLQDILPGDDQGAFSNRNIE